MQYNKMITSLYISHIHLQQTHICIYKVCWDKTLPAYPSCPSFLVDQDYPEKDREAEKERDTKYYGQLW